MGYREIIDLPEFKQTDIPINQLTIIEIYAKIWDSFGSEFATTKNAQKIKEAAKKKQLNWTPAEITINGDSNFRISKSPH